MEKLYIIMPVYNEEANIQKVIEDWYPIIEKYGWKRPIEIGRN